MNRGQKELLLNSLKQDFVKDQAAFLINYKGLSVSKMQALRKDLRNSGGKLKVAKRRIIKIAVQDLPGTNELMPFLRDQIAVVFSEGEPNLVAKVLYNFSKENKEVGIIAGTFDSQLLDKNLIEELSKLPAREVLLAQVCGTLKMPMTQLVRTLNALLEKISSGSKQEEVKESEG